MVSRSAFPASHSSSKATSGWIGGLAACMVIRGGSAEREEAARRIATGEPCAAQMAKSVRYPDTVVLPQRACPHDHAPPRPELARRETGRRLAQRHRRL